MDNKFDAILHVLQKRNIWMKNKKECRSTDRSASNLKHITAIQELVEVQNKRMFNSY